MRRHRCYVWVGAVLLLLTACSVSGESEARQWVEAHAPVSSPAASMDLPLIVDTPPTAYTAKGVADPFSLGRIGQSRPSMVSSKAEAPGSVHFADTTLEALRAVGVLEVQGRYVALLEGGSGFANAKVGDRLGNQELEVVEISTKGIRLRKADGSEFWMPINRRSH